MTQIYKIDFGVLLPLLLAAVGYIYNALKKSQAKRTSEGKPTQVSRPASGPTQTAPPRTRRSVLEEMFAPIEEAEYAYGDDFEEEIVPEMQHQVPDQEAVSVQAQSVSQASEKETASPITQSDSAPKRKPKLRFNAREAIIYSNILKPKHF